MNINQQFDQVFADIKNSKFKAGVSDCREGLKPQEQNPDYVAGFAAQYEREQKESARCKIWKN